MAQKAMFKAGGGTDGNFALCGIIGHRLLRGCCPEREDTLECGY